MYGIWTREGGGGGGGEGGVSSLELLTCEICRQCSGQLGIPGPDKVPVCRDTSVELFVQGRQFHMLGDVQLVFSHI